MLDALTSRRPPIPDRRIVEADRNTHFQSSTCAVVLAACAAIDPVMQTWIPAQCDDRGQIRGNADVLFKCWEKAARVTRTV